MCKLLVLCFSLLLPLSLCDSFNNASELESVPAQKLSNQSVLLPTPEKLTRYRRHPFKLRGSSSKRGKQRRRTKGGSKHRYAAPSYVPAPSISYYKPSPPSPPAYAAHNIEEPSFSISDFPFNGADFKIPASSYEAQSMDLNLYSHDDDPDLYGAHKFPSLEYNFGHEQEPSSPPLSSYAEHVPHQKYGVPPLQQSIGPSYADYAPPPPPAPPSTKYGVPSYPAPAPPPSQQYGVPAAPPSQQYGVPAAPPSHQYGVPAAPPSQQYGVPAAPPSQHYSVPAAPPSQQYAPAHVPSYTHSAPPPPPPPAPDSYSIYEQKIPNVGYHQSFAEPPPKAPPSHNANFEISYSPPAYEISTSYQENEPQYDHNYETPSHNDEYEQPPSENRPQEHPQENPPQYPPEHAPQHPSQHPPQYLPEYPPEHPPQHPPQYPPEQPPEHPPRYSQAEPIPSHEEEHYAPPDELPLNPNHNPSFDFPKSSYEVPIYDPILFESSNREQESFPPIDSESFPPIDSESFPPILNIHNPNELPSDADATGSSQSLAKRRKRKRRPSAVVSKKHTLDVPELQEAYDADSHVHIRGTDQDTAAHGSQYVEQKRSYVNYVRQSSTTPTTTTTTASPWSPMRQRTTSSGVFLPTILTSTPPSHTTSRSRSRGTSRYRSRNQPSTEAASTVVTIQKSRSQSYYDGTIAPPTYREFTRPTRPTTQTPGTRPAQFPGRGVGATLALKPNTERNPALKRTTKGVFDTTIFKSPQSDREIEHRLNFQRQNLPKNHKLY